MTQTQTSDLQFSEIINQTDLGDNILCRCVSVYLHGVYIGYVWTEGDMFMDWTSTPDVVEALGGGPDDQDHGIFGELTLEETKEFLTALHAKTGKGKPQVQGTCFPFGN